MYYYNEPYNYEYIFIALNKHISKYYIINNRIKDIYL